MNAKKVEQKNVGECKKKIWWMSKKNVEPKNVDECKKNGAWKKLLRNNVYECKKVKEKWWYI